MDKTDCITDYIHERDLNSIALTETNISKLTPDGDNFVHNSVQLPRSDRQGEGFGVLYKSCLTVILSRP